MAMSWMSGVSQTAVVQEARQFATRHKQAEFATVAARYAAVGCDVVALSDRLLALADEALATRARADAAQARYEVESAQSREVVGRVSEWLRKLHLGARYASVAGHPLGAHLLRLFASGDLQAESWIGAATSLQQVLDNLGGASDLAGYGISAAFVDEGRRLSAELLGETGDQTLAESQRTLHTARLHELLDEIVAIFERVAAAREFAMAMTGEDIPGFSLTFARAAAASPGAPSPAPAPAPEGTGDTGL